MKQIPFIKYAWVWVTTSTLIMLASFVLFGSIGLRPGIDFTGGSLLQVSFTADRPDNTIVAEQLKTVGVNDALVQKAGDTDLLIRSSFLTEEQHQKVITLLRATYGDKQVVEKSFETIGAAVSQNLRQRSLWATLVVCVAIMLYIAYAFRRVSHPVASWKYGALAIFALVHDVMLVIGVFVLLGKFHGVEIDIGFIVALLTVLGYSVSDTIVVYDRIRENLVRRGREEFGDVVNAGLNQTLMRSVNTTLTTLLPLFALYFLGGNTIRNFSLALIIGIASGAYSSIFIASPLLVLVERWQRRA